MADVEILRLGNGKNVPGKRSLQEAARESRKKQVLAYLRSNPGGIDEIELRRFINVDQKSMWTVLDELTREKRVNVEKRPFWHGRSIRKYWPVGA